MQIFNYLTENIIKKMKVSPPDAEALRMFLILPLYHEMRNPRRHPELQVYYTHVMISINGNWLCLPAHAHSGEYVEGTNNVAKLHHTHVYGVES